MITLNEIEAGDPVQLVDQRDTPRQAPFAWTEL
jgi:hypothetical protein